MLDRLPAGVGGCQLHQPCSIPAQPRPFHASRWTLPSSKLVNSRRTGMTSCWWRTSLGASTPHVSAASEVTRTTSGSSPLAKPNLVPARTVSQGLQREDHAGAP
ncbi:hypothetical protein D1007_32337 [Hordeum vulgare]|nr:hypothetical protein D1007_32337 [Hordeum vulgare]